MLMCVVVTVVVSVVVIVVVADVWCWVAAELVTHRVAVLAGGRGALADEITKTCATANILQLVARLC